MSLHTENTEKSSEDKASTQFLLVLWVIALMLTGTGIYLFYSTNGHRKTTDSVHDSIRESRNDSAFIFIASVPPAADVYYGDTYIGRTNVSELKVPAGPCMLRFVKGGREVSREFNLNIGKNPSQMVRIPDSLPRMPTPFEEDESIQGSVSENQSEEAFVYIASVPPGSDVYLGDQWIGKTNLNELKVPVGRCELQFVKDGQEMTKVFQFQPGRNPTETVHLETNRRIILPDRDSRYGYAHEGQRGSDPALIFIASIPPVADVYLNESFIGKTNIEELRIPAGRQVLRFVKGAKEIEKVFILKPGKNPSQMVRIP